MLTRRKSAKVRMFGKSSRAYDDEDVDVANNYVLDHDDDDDDDGNNDDVRRL